MAADSRSVSRSFSIKCGLFVTVAVPNWFELDKQRVRSNKATRAKPNRKWSAITAPTSHRWQANNSPTDRVQAAAREPRRILCLQSLTHSASWLKTYRRSRPCQATNTNTIKTTSFSRRLRRFLTKSSRIASPTKPRETASRSWLSLPVRVTSKENCFQIRRTLKPSRRAMLRPSLMTKSS